MGAKGAASLMLCLWVFAERGNLMAEAAASSGRVYLEIFTLKIPMRVLNANH